MPACWQPRRWTSCSRRSAEATAYGKDGAPLQAPLSVLRRPRFAVSSPIRSRLRHVGGCRGRGLDLLATRDRGLRCGAFAAAFAGAAFPAATFLAAARFVAAFFGAAAAARLRRSFVASGLLRPQPSSRGRLLRRSGLLAARRSSFRHAAAFFARRPGGGLLRGDLLRGGLRGRRLDGRLLRRGLPGGRLGSRLLAWWPAPPAPWHSVGSSLLQWSPGGTPSLTWWRTPATRTSAARPVPQHANDTWRNGDGSETLPAVTNHEAAQCRRFVTVARAVRYAADVDAPSDVEAPP